MTAARPGGGLGLGMGWRPELALMIERRADLGFVEVVAENFMGLDRARRVPVALQVLRERGLAVVPHGLSLSLGGAEALQRARLKALAGLARQLDSPLVSEHLAFVRAGNLESGHLLPVPRTRESLEVVVRNVRDAQAMLPAPLVLENIASLFEWPGAEMTEAQFLAEVVDRTGAGLLLDLENLYANARNLGWDMAQYLDGLPLDRVAYVHMAGGAVGHDGLYHDTHAHGVPNEVFALLGALCERQVPAGIMIERDGDFPPDAVLHAELDAVAAWMGGRSMAVGPAGGLAAVASGPSAVPA